MHAMRAIIRTNKVLDPSYENYRVLKESREESHGVEVVDAYNCVWASAL